MFEIEAQVTPDHITPPYNHVHHATVLSFLESARVEFLKYVGFPNDEFLAKGLFMVITGITVRYKREVVVGQIRVTCENPRIQGKLVLIEQRIFNSKGKVALEALVESQFLDKSAGRAVKVPDDFRAAFVQAGT
ncbi:MAG: acyl-CoA thioesterase [Deltaproteobacteria bacterium]|nr:acyl-CoA thioesterase [Deltaproteobacteria bacterium]